MTLRPRPQQPNWNEEEAEKTDQKQKFQQDEKQNNKTKQSHNTPQPLSKLMDLVVGVSVGSWIGAVIALEMLDNKSTLSAIKQEETRRKKTDEKSSRFREEQSESEASDSFEETVIAKKSGLIQKFQKRHAERAIIVSTPAEKTQQTK